MKTIDITKFKSLDNQSYTEAVAAFLDWARQKYPYQPIPYNLVCKVVLRTKKAPSMASQEVAALKGRLGGIRSYMYKKYERGIVSTVGFGIRATVDSMDEAKTTFRARIKRQESATRATIQSAAVIDAASMPKTAEGAQWRNYVERHLPQLQRIGELADKARLALPASSTLDADDETKAKK